MGTLIEAVATASPHSGPFGRGALRLADIAARRCLTRAERTPGEVDLLVNTGLYHDRGIGEPALAALIQEDIGANPGHPPGVGHGTFSFDLYNGGCGVLTALSLVDGFLATGTIGLGMVVASDADPGTGLSEQFPFSPMGGAVLLRWGANDEQGFVDFGLETFPEFADLFRSEVHWQATQLVGAPRSHNVLAVEIAGTYLTHALECAESATTRFADRAGLDLADVDVLVATGSVAGFAQSLAPRIGIDPRRVADADGLLSSAHTAAPLVGLEAAANSGRLEQGRTALLVSAGAGITVATALYRCPPEPWSNSDGSSRSRSGVYRRG